MRNILKISILSLFFLIGWDAVAQSSAASRYATTSVLSSGRWVRIAIASDGIYQISHDDLRAWGFSNPAQVKVHGYGGKALPEDFRTTYIDDLPEIPVLRQSNRLLFFASGTITWTYDKTSGDFLQDQHPYSTAGYYFITENSKTPVAFASEDEIELSSPTKITKFSDYALHESELINVGHTGRQLLGENFRYTYRQNFTFDIPGLTSDPVKMRVNFAAKIGSGKRIQIKHYHNDKLLDVSTSDYINGNNDNYAHVAFSSSQKQWYKDDNINDKITIEYSGETPMSAYLDYIRLNMKRDLSLYNNVVRFREPSAIGNIRYVIGNAQANNIEIWNITTPYFPKKISPRAENGAVVFDKVESSLSEYIAFNPQAAFPSPSFVEIVGNQDMHALSNYDYVIVTVPELITQAQRLADEHRTKNKLSVYVTTLQPIYNEFSSGTPDATAVRRFLKMFYDRAQSEKERPRYLLMLGDGIYDNRKLSPELKNINIPFLITYQSKDSWNEKIAYTGDDYFGFLEDNSGKNFLTDKQCLGIGRLPVRTVSEAKNVIDKLIKYVENKDLGNWKNQLCFLADDEENGTFLKQSEDVINVAKSVSKDFIYNKLYTDAFIRHSSASGNSYPDAKKKFKDLLNDGLLYVNFLGHANQMGLTGEDMLNMTDVKQMYIKRLPLWLTATCDFARYDDIPSSAGEELLLHPNGGGIALITASRVVYINENGDKNLIFIKYMFRKNADGTRMTLGDIMRSSKNEINNGELANKMSYHLLGDPAMKLAYPEYKMELTEINNESLSTGIPLLKAMQKVTMKGRILDKDGNIVPDFNGIVYPVMYDSREKVVTHGYSTPGENSGGVGVVKEYEDYLKLLYMGRDSVKNGEFTFEFKIPKEINYSDIPGLLNLYAYDNVGREAHGSNDNIVINGLDGTIDPETAGPVIKTLYLNTTNFKDGDKVDSTPLLVADVDDPSGINISGNGLGHDITLTIDGKKSYVLNSYFIPEVGRFGAGCITYKIPEMSSGRHELTFKVWDTENNSSQKTIYCEVDKGLKPKIFDLYVDQNPASESTRFYLRHDRPNSIINMRISVYTPMGVEVWSHVQEGMADMNVSFPIEWYLTDFRGQRLPAGIYLYRAHISTDGINESTEAKKIAITAQ